MPRIVTASPRAQPGEFVVQSGYAAFGQGSPTEQVGASVALATIAYLSAAISFGATLVFALLFTGTLFVGVLRFIAQDTQLETATVGIAGFGLLVLGLGAIVGGTVLVIGAGILVVAAVYELLSRR